MISVIVPVHNTKKYIHKCIDSVLEQTYKDIEIICIDSSTDETSDILKKYAINNDKIHHIIDVNSSYGYKLNKGFAIANGEYIAIVDSDDYIMPSMFETLLREVEDNDLDFVKSDYERFYIQNNTEIITEYKDNLWDNSYYDQILDLKKEKKLLNLISVSIWTGLYKRSFVINNNIYLNESPAASFQDTGFSVFTHLYANRVKYIHQSFYKYRTDNNDSSFKSQKNYKMIADEWRWIENELRKRNIDKDILIEIHLKKYSSYYWNYCRLNDTAKLMFSCYIFEEMYEECVNQQTINYCPDFLKKQIQSYWISASVYAKMTSDIEMINNLLKTENVVIASADILGQRIVEYASIAGINGIYAICDSNVKYIIANNEAKIVCDLSEINLTDKIVLIPNKNSVDEIKERVIKLGVKEKNIIIIKEFLKYSNDFSMTVSVIVPIFNAEKYIEICIKSLLKQSEKSIEIILVDDGSSDNSLEICQRYERDHCNIKVIHQENFGVNNARYLGILASDSKYICFVDSDDWVEPEYIRSMLNEAELYNADMVIGNIYLNNETTASQNIKKNQIKSGLYADDKLKNELYPNMLWYPLNRDNKYNMFGILQYLPSKLYKRQIIQNELAIIDRNIFDAEDVVCVFSMLIDAQRIYISDICNYHYRIHNESETHNKRGIDYLINAGRIYRSLSDKFGADKYLRIQLQHFIAYYINNSSMELFGYRYVPEPIYRSWQRPKNLNFVNKRVAIYGAGKLGKACYKDIIDIKGIEIVAWFDTNIFNTKYGGFTIKSAKDINEYSFDYLIIAIANIIDCNTVRKYCLECGIADNKIILPNVQSYLIKVEAE